MCSLTGTITYKWKVSTLGYTSACDDFVPGDRVYIYTDTGRVLCDTVAISSTIQLGMIDGYMHFSVRINPKDLDPKLLEGYVR